MSIKASQILAMMKRLGFRVTGYGRGGYRCEDGDFIAVFTRGTKKVRGTKDKRHHKLVRRLQNGLFPPYRDYWSEFNNRNHSDWQRHYASVKRRSYGYLCAQFDCCPGDTDDQRYMRLSIDNGKAWDKPANCPIILYAGNEERNNELTAWPLPELERRLRKVCGRLATKAGYEASIGYDDIFILADTDEW